MTILQVENVSPVIATAQHAVKLQLIVLLVLLDILSLLLSASATKILVSILLSRAQQQPAVQLKFQPL